MGINGLVPFLKKVAPAALSPAADLSAYSTLAVDAPLWLSQFLYGDGLEDRKKRILVGTATLVRSLRKTGVEPIFVFDGPIPLKQKAITHVKRSKARQRTSYEALVEESRIVGMTPILTNMRALMSSEERNTFPKRAVAKAEDDIEEDQEKDDSSHIFNLASDTFTPALGTRTIPAYLIKDCRKKARALEKTVFDQKLNRNLQSSVQSQVAMFRSLGDDTQLGQAYAQIASVYDESQNSCKRKAKWSERLSRSDIELVQQCLNVMNVHHVQSAHEGEALCAAITEAGFADATSSEDTDVLLFGDGPLVRRVFSQTQETLHLHPPHIREQLGMSSAQFVDFAILLGTDFSGTLTGVGPKRAFNLIRKYGSMEEILKNEPKWTAGEHWDYEAARNVFLNLRERVTPELREVLEMRTRTRASLVRNTFYEGDTMGFLKSCDFSDQEAFDTLNAIWTK
ncbi:PIN domain-like protein [Powellomyces hirtus]|nr:PIN domain-like protein [Powellomyces hirtus]